MLVNFSEIEAWVRPFFSRSRRKEAEDKEQRPVKNNECERWTSPWFINRGHFIVVIVYILLFLLLRGCGVRSPHPFISLSVLSKVAICHRFYYFSRLFFFFVFLGSYSRSVPLWGAGEMLVFVDALPARRLNTTKGAPEFPPCLWDCIFYEPPNYGKVSGWWISLVHFLLLFLESITFSKCLHKERVSSTEPAPYACSSSERLKTEVALVSGIGVLASFVYFFCVMPASCEARVKIIKNIFGELPG